MPQLEVGESVKFEGLNRTARNDSQARGCIDMSALCNVLQLVWGIKPPQGDLVFEW
jgi:hypothetical protein